MLAGIKLSSIDIEPESAITTISGVLSDAIEKNAPLILTPQETSFFSNKGFVQLENVTFEYLGAVRNPAAQASTDPAPGNQPNPLINGLNVDVNPSPMLLLRAGVSVKF